MAGYERETQATLLALCQLSQRPARFFDVGAHIGLYSALIAAVYPPGAVCVTAFEPTPATATIARQLARANNLQVTVEECALSSEQGVATLYISEKTESSNSLVEGFRSSSQSVTVPVTTLDGYCLRSGTTPTVIKIDVETFESHVLMGAMRTLASARPWVVCELLPRATPELTERVLERIRELGYSIYHWTVASGWTESVVADVLATANSTHRDWLFAPAPISADLRTAIDRWLAAINECTADTNVFIDAGSVRPDGWNALYDPADA